MFIIYIEENIENMCNLKININHHQFKGMAADPTMRDHAADVTDKTSKVLASLQKSFVNFCRL